MDELIIEWILLFFHTVTFSSLYAQIVIYQKIQFIFIFSDKWRLDSNGVLTLPESLSNLRLTLEISDFAKPKFSFRDSDCSLFVPDLRGRGLTENKTGLLATVENGKTESETISVYGRRRRKANPFIEFSSSTPAFAWIRLSGEVKFSDDVKR